MQSSSIRKHLQAKKKPLGDLFDAVMAGNLTEVKRLIRSGAKLDARRNHLTPLMFAALQGWSEVAEYLIKQGADVNARNDIGQTALMIAALSGHKAIIELLVVAGADVRAVDKNKLNAVGWATSRGDFPEVISTLVVLGADYNTTDIAGLTPLMRAALLGYANSAAMLLTVGADETIRFRGKTAYEMAAEKGHKQVCEDMKAILEQRPKGHSL